MTRSPALSLSYLPCSRPLVPTTSSAKQDQPRLHGGGGGGGSPKQQGGGGGGGGILNALRLMASKTVGAATSSPPRRGRFVHGGSLGSKQTMTMRGAAAGARPRPRPKAAVLHVSILVSVATCVVATYALFLSKLRHPGRGVGVGSGSTSDGVVVVSENTAGAAAMSSPPLGADGNDRPGIADLRPPSEEGEEEEEEDNPEWRIGRMYRFPRHDTADDTTTGSGERQPPCSLTAVFTDPRLPIFPRMNDAYRRAIESLAHFGPPGTCMVLQTSSCILNHEGADDDGEPVPESDDVFKMVGERIYQRAGPRFRTMIDSGRVRLSILNHTKYGLQACDNFGGITKAYTNLWYYADEFLHGIDSDAMLFLQSDSFLCRPLEVDNGVDHGDGGVRGGWGRFAWVGGVWRPRYFLWGPVKRMWNTPFFKVKTPSENLERGEAENPGWDADAWTRYWNEHGEAVDGSIRRHSLEPLPQLSSSTTTAGLPLPRPFFPRVFPNDFARNGTVGNGGLSIRSRKWLLRAIRVCPFVDHSGLPPDVLAENACTLPPSTNDDGTATVVYDDQYFSSLLPVIGAPMPRPFEAAVFATECEPASADWIMPRDGVEVNETILRLRGTDGVDDFWRTIGEYGRSVSVGYHNCREKCGTCPEVETCPYSNKRRFNYRTRKVPKQEK